MKTVIWHKTLLDIWGKKVLYKRGEPVSKIHNPVIVFYTLLYFLLDLVDWPPLLFCITFCKWGAVMGPTRRHCCLYHIPHFMEDHKHCLKQSFVLRLWMVRRRGARRGALCKSRRFPCCWDFMGRHEQGRALQQWPSLIVTGVTLIIPCGNILRCLNTIFIYFSVEVASSKP